MNEVTVAMTETVNGWQDISTLNIDKRGITKYLLWEPGYDVYIGHWAGEWISMIGRSRCHPKMWQPVPIPPQT